MKYYESPLQNTVWSLRVQSAQKSKWINVYHHEHSCACFAVCVTQVRADDCSEEWCWRSLRKLGACWPWDLLPLIWDLVKSLLQGRHYAGWRRRDEQDRSASTCTSLSAPWTSDLNSFYPKRPSGVREAAPVILKHNRQRSHENLSIGPSNSDLVKSHLLALKNGFSYSVG